MNSIFNIYLMPKTARLVLLFSGFSALLAMAIFQGSPRAVLSAANHIVISEIQIEGSVADNEFVELYNPTGDPVDLTGWRLARRTASAITDTNNLVASMSGTIPAHGFF